MTYKIDAVLFDLDGTLLDTAKEFHLALNGVLKKEGKESQEFKKVRVKVSDGAGALVTLGFNIDEQSINFEEKRNALLKAYKKVFLDSKPFEGVDEVCLLYTSPSPRD